MVFAPAVARLEVEKINYYCYFHHLKAVELYCWVAHSVRPVFSVTIVYSAERVVAVAFAVDVVGAADDDDVGQMGDAMHYCCCFQLAVLFLSQSQNLTFDEDVEVGRKNVPKVVVGGAAAAAVVVGDDDDDDDDDCQQLNYHQHQAPHLPVVGSNVKEDVHYSKTDGARREHWP